MFPKKSVNLEEEILTELIRKSDAKAFEQLFRFFYSDLCSYLRTIIKDRAIIEEIVQEVFVSIWENRINFSPKGNLKSYLFRSVRNKAINYYKHERVKQKSWEELKLIYFSDNDSIEKQINEIELDQLLKKHVALLPEKCREIFILVMFNGLSYKETAEILSLSIKTIENQMGRALRKLKESLLIYFN